MTRVPTRNLRPAELKDGCYVKPYTLLEIEQLWAGRREVWTKSHGRATRYHIMIDGGVAACRPFRDGRWTYYNGILICEDTLVPIGQVPAHMVCRRNGCRQIFDAFLT